jgi:hypothetical protein
MTNDNDIERTARYLEGAAPGSMESDKYAAALIRRLRDERDVARKALEPFASCFMKPQTKYMIGHKDYDSEPLDELTADGLTFGHLRAAFLALKEPEP